MFQLELVVQRRRGLLVWFGSLVLLLGLADPRGLLRLPILFLLKDTLGLPPSAVAAFEAIAFVPVLLGFVGGFLRDRWRAAGTTDRTLLLATAPLVAVCYGLLAVGSFGYAGMLAAVLVIMASFQIMDAVVHALISVAAQRHRMTGRLSALSELGELAPQVLGLLLGGWLAAHAAPASAFWAAALLAAAIGALVLQRPAATFPLASKAAGVAEDTRSAFLRLLRHRPLWPALAILAAWNFAPGWDTPLLYYLTDDVGVSREVFGLCRAVNLAGIAAMAVLYGLYLQRAPLRRLLFWGVAINVLAGVPLLFIDGAPAAVGASALAGLACGIGNVAVFELLLRSCPEDLEGSAMMLGFAALGAAEVGGDIAGAVFYEHGGFVPCLVLDALATLSILPLSQRVPSHVIDAHEAEWTRCLPLGLTSPADAE